MQSEGANIGWCGYLLSRGESPPADPITIDASFNTFNGHYLFALVPPVLTDEASVVAFSNAVYAYLDRGYGNGFSFNGRACVWIPDPVTPTFGNPGGYGFPFSQGLSGYLLGADMNNPMGAQLTLAVRKDSSIRVGETGLMIGSASTQPASFITTTANQGPAISRGPVTIPLLGPYSGCFLIQGTLATSTTLSYFNAGLLYAHVGSNGAADVTQNYPVVGTGGGGMILNYIGAVDPLDPVNHSATTVDTAQGQLRTLLALVPGSGLPPRMASYMRTAQNQSLSLVPITSGDVASGPAPNSGALVFEYATPVTGGPLYMTFAGDFGLALPDGASAPASGSSALLCGLFGSETMSFRPYSSSGPFDPLRFIPANAAYAPVFPFADASLNNPGSGSLDVRLVPAYRTSWAMLINGSSGDVRYMAQPESSPLFVPTGSSAADGTSLLDPYMAGTKLPAEPGFAVPMVPYTGVNPAGGFGQGDLVTFESQILSPTRKGRIAEGVAVTLGAEKQARRSNLVATAAPTSAATPQGLLADVVEGSIGADYVKVTLANSPQSAGGSPEMAFLNLGLPLQNLFQTNQLFAVIVDPTHLGEMVDLAPQPVPSDPAFFENTVTIADWTMEANVGNGVMATDYRNVMIFKFGDGTVAERVANPNKWVQAEQFSLAPGGGDPSLSLTGLSSWLQGFIAEAVMEATVRKNDLYMNFAAIVTDPNWNGVLVLRADVGRFPDQIKGLTAGIDVTQFEAHHFGVTVSRVTVDGGTVTLDGPSSMFGLIDYQLPLYRQSAASGANPDLPLMIPADGAYGFTVLQLQALFKNTALVDFRSRVQLTINDLFGSKVTATYAPGGESVSNGVVLKGSYQTQGTTSTYVFEQSSTTVFLLDSNVFNAVALDRVQFNTLTPDTGGDDPSVVSRFLIWGTFDFVEMTDPDGNPFDLFSFGTPSGTPVTDRRRGLVFSNLQITMTSPVDTPNAAAFAFNATGLAFNPSVSTVRAGSLFPTFALQLDSFIASNGEKRPSEMGYLAVGAKVSLAAIAGPWFGVVYKVTMGTPGALVSGAGFESRLLLAWSPQSKSTARQIAAFAGLQLPGAAPGAKLLSLQGVLKVSVGSIQLTYDTVVGSTAKAFNLRLSNVGLKFLGIVKLPPSATINFFLFGDPGGTGSLGWYAAYIEDNLSMAVPLDDGARPMLLESTVNDSSKEML